MISFFLSIIYLSKGVTNSSVIFELLFNIFKNQEPNVRTACLITAIYNGA